MSKTAILVTGCGGDIGQNIGKIIRQHYQHILCHGADIHSSHPGEFIFSQCHTLPAVSSPGYLRELESLTETIGASLVIPASEPEIRFLSGAGIKRVAGAQLLTANEKVTETGFDKLKTVQFLKEEGLPYPLTSILAETESPALPCIIKDRAGSGSKAILKIESEKDFLFYKQKFPSFICQEYLKPDDEEYTCGVYRALNGQTRTIIMKRKLIGGLTGSGEIVLNKGIDHVLRQIARGLDLRGSINVQLRLVEKGPVVFEINPRFSSTILFRHLLGFRDLIWAIEEAWGREPGQYTLPKPGTKFYRGSQEYIKHAS